MHQVSVEIVAALWKKSLQQEVPCQINFSASVPTIVAQPPRTELLGQMTCPLKLLVGIGAGLPEHCSQTQIYKEDIKISIFSIVTHYSILTAGALTSEGSNALYV